MTTKTRIRGRSARRIAMVALLLAPVPAAAQVVVQDARGRDVVLDYFNPNVTDVRPASTALTLNSASESLTGRVLIPGGDFVNQQFHAFEVEVEAEDGVANLFEDGEWTGVQSLGYRYGRSHVLLSDADNDIDFLVLGVDYSVATTYRLFDQSAAPEDQLTSVDFSGLELSGIYTRLIRGAARASLSVGYRRENNYADLRSVSVQDGRSITGPDGVPRTVVTRTTQAREGDYAESDVFPVGVSLVTMPSEAAGDAKRIKPGFAAYGFADITRESGPPLRLGMNVNLTRQDEDTSIRNTIGGVFIEAADVFDVARAGSGLSDRITIGVFLNLKVLEF